MASRAAGRSRTDGGGVGSARGVGGGGAGMQTLNPVHSSRSGRTPGAAARRLSAAVTVGEDSVGLRNWGLRELWLRVVRNAAAALMLGIIFALLAAHTTLYEGYNTLAAVVALVAAALYTWEAVAVAPFVLGWREVRRTLPTSHNKRVLVQCEGRSMAVNAPAVARGAFMSCVWWGAPVLLLVGALQFASDVNMNYLNDFCLFFSLLGAVLGWLYRCGRALERKVLRTREQRQHAEAARGIVSEAHKPRGVFRVMTLNVNSCVGADGAFDVQRVADVIVRSGAHVVALQDLERCARIGRAGEPLPVHRSQTDALAQLAEITGMHAEFCPKTAAFGGQFGNAVLSRLPVSNTTRLHFSSWRTHSSNADGGPMPQCAVAVALRPPKFNHDVWIVSASLGADRSGVEQLNEMGELVNFVRSLTAFDEPAGSGNPDAVEVDVGVRAGLLGRDTQVLPSNVVLCGDLQSPDAAPAMQLAEVVGLRDVADLRGGAPKGTWGLAKATYPADKPRVNADRVLVRGYKASVGMVQVEVLDGCDASTHLPVVVDFVDKSKSPM
mmetsp:Transcript_5303/g.19034  ORF Transcript_5303/g.19034 Transcript_5303/m.19034 type:complete len:553 (-) Transcript_5303:52-1710(-)